TADTFLRGDLSGVARAAAIGVGLASAAAGFGVECLRMARRSWGKQSSPTSDVSEPANAEPVPQATSAANGLIDRFAVLL
ncbi:hypothetical protein ABTE09_20905, partial [Acinetobacter baumannii]